MPHKPDYQSPWGKPQSAEEMAQIHKRWVVLLRADTGRTHAPCKDERTLENGLVVCCGDCTCLAQCGGCSYFIPLEGSIGMDWGACSNLASPHDRKVVFEHFGCKQHSEWAMYEEEHGEGTE